jgi:hypothetical protein
MVFEAARFSLTNEGFFAIFLNVFAKLHVSSTCHAQLNRTVEPDSSRDSSRFTPEIAAIAAGLRIALFVSVSRPTIASEAVAFANDARRNLVNPSDELFFSLEGRTLESRGSQWRIEVCGVHSAALYHWIQLNLRGPMQCGLTLRADRLDASDVVDVVQDWLDDSVPTDVEPCLIGKIYKPVVRH